MPLNSWEYYERVEFKANGKTIKVDEWRKDFKEGRAVIRMGYMRIDNCPRYQIIILFNDARIMPNNPPFRNFNDALEAADSWLSYRDNRSRFQRRMLTAVPMSADDLQIPESAVQSASEKPKRVRKQMPKRAGMKRLNHDELTAVITEEYRKQDAGKVSLTKLCDLVSERIGYEATHAMISLRTGKTGLDFRGNREAALAKARPIVKKAIKKMIDDNPNWGAGQVL